MTSYSANKGKKSKTCPEEYMLESEKEQEHIMCTAEEFARKERT
jgi:hypothetical protein